MTTVCARAGVMAADRQCRWDGNRATVTKMFRTENEIIGWSGGVAAAMRLREWYLAGADPKAPPPFQSFGADDKPSADLLILRRDGSLWHVSQHLALDRVMDDFWAIGSGTSAALAAMHMGADAKRAVEIAHLVDCDTGGELEMASFGLPSTPWTSDPAIIAPTASISVAETRYQEARREARFNGA